ncbi:hypothetical protein H0H92_012898 [Tricholoma furcatifolium]|nr:hypothetical protein H0H92_012898 [Tricholoma furcatifolium]
MSRRRQGTKSPDGAPLTDEGDGVITFLDDCVLRCLKTLYRYIEDLDALENLRDGPSQRRTERVEPLPNPLLVMTVLGQLKIKVSKKIVSGSDVLALASFVRKLMRLSSKQQDLRFLPSTKEPCRLTACELIDWMRLLEDDLGSAEISRVSAIFLKLYPPPSLSMVAEFTASPVEFLWKGPDIVSRSVRITSTVLPGSNTSDEKILSALDTPTSWSLSSTPRTSTSLPLVFLESILATVKTSTKSEFDSEGELVRRLPQLVELNSRTPMVSEELVAITILSNLPAYHDRSRCEEALEETSMAEIIKEADLK